MSTIHRTNLVIAWGDPGTGKSLDCKQAAENLVGENEIFYKLF